MVIAEIRLCRRQHAAAELHLRHAMDLNPSDPDLKAMMGYLLTMRGKPDEGLTWLRRAVHLNPLHPGWYHNDLGMALHHAGQFEEAIAHLQMIPRVDRWWNARIASCYAALGDTAAAARHMAQAEAECSGWDPIQEFREGLEIEHTESLDFILRGLRSAIDAYRAQGD
jgi:Flp pilus assembly protein TadD